MSIQAQRDANDYGRLDMQKKERVRGRVVYFFYKKVKDVDGVEYGGCI